MNIVLWTIWSYNGDECYHPLEYGTADRHYSYKLFIKLYLIDKCLEIILIAKVFRFPLMTSFSLESGSFTLDSLTILVKFAIRSGKSTTLYFILNRVAPTNLTPPFPWNSMELTGNTIIAHDQAVFHVQAGGREINGKVLFGRDCPYSMEINWN